ncbi:MAG: hypothetical protein HZA31_02690 [Opitutae bacterium]|nr:hypothetical protein [Opitutae bacterium]
MKPWWHAVFPASWRPTGYLHRRIVEREPLSVLSGPFAGLRYIAMDPATAWLPKLLGTYERELHGVCAEIAALKPRATICVGSAEGYYAVGLLWRGWTLKVIAFESDATRRDQLAQMAALNEVADRVEIRGEGNTPALAAALAACAEPPLIVCDIEGAEAHLLDPAHCPGLAAAALLVELHETLAPGVTATLRERFAATHAIREIAQQPRTAADFPLRWPVAWAIPFRYKRGYLEEGRVGQMSWLWLRPKSRP